MEGIINTPQVGEHDFLTQKRSEAGLGYGRQNCRDLVPTGLEERQPDALEYCRSLPLLRRALAKLFVLNAVRPWGLS